MKAIQCIGVLLVAARTGIGAQDPLSAARDLYASAAYEDALTELSHLDPESSPPEVTRQANEYRAFCLYALGRTREAESVAEAMIRKDPLARLNAVDASPRIETMFADVRKRLLPSLIRERFRTARSAVDQKRLSIAEPPLTEARLMIVEAEKLGVKDEGLSDLSVLVDGFLQLIRSTLEQQAAPARPPAVGSVAVPEPQAVAGAGPRVNPPPAAAASAPVPPLRAALAGKPRLYSIDDQDVSPPVAIDQRMPTLPAEMTRMIKATQATGLLEVVIDETGRVVDATIRQSVNLGFDGAILRTARGWKYRPAMKDGVPVRYVKILALVP